MGVPDDIALGAVRFSLGRRTTAAEIDTVVAALASLEERATPSII
jgi:cysteine desulfurase